MARHYRVYYVDLLKKDYKVILPEELLDFFRPRQHYHSLPSSSNETPVTYKAIEGEAIPLPKELESWEERFDLPEWPCENTDEKSKLESDRSARKAIQLIYAQRGQNIAMGDISRISKTYMRVSRTRPLKVEFKKLGSKGKDRIYVKKADTNRIIGRFLYDCISGINPLAYIFNRLCFIEEEIRGTTLEQMNESILLDSEQYRQGVVRAAAHAEFLGMYEDVLDPINRIIDKEKRTILFDFDVLFAPREKNNSLILLNEYIEQNALDIEDLEVFSDEQYKVVQRFNNNQTAIMKLARISGSLIDGTGVSLDKRIQECYNASCFEDYLEKKIAEFEKAAGIAFARKQKSELFRINNKSASKAIRGLT